jgi:3-methylfumaryl-CoA hydratase
VTASGDYRDWISRSEEQRDVVTPGPLDRLAATLDRDDPAFGTGDAAPPCWHWLFFPPHARQSELGPDGHPRRGGFLPPVHDLPRRMWAGSRIVFPGEILVGEEIIRRSTVTSVRAKTGRSGPLLLVSVRHEIGRGATDPAIIEEHDIVYRGSDAPAVLGSGERTPPGPWRRVLTPDPVLLFRYSALTYNGHRIHYDRNYATAVEGYPGLVVHGPLTAMLLLDLVRRSIPHGRVASFSFRAVSPLFDGAEMSLNGVPPDAEGRVRLWACGPGARLAMQAEVRLGAHG